ncbi:HAD family hydrolase [Haloarcula japonica]|uniref:Haloacid dehalogenase domain-containing protein hydrolase n=1 Tax=Haloarcula japonica (strain ATCC 49778 / DSM 6131 / JCM 7785 / NBRC 101032 / NCIMB 13157 / TR-1) TaxID=1227453 RepID=M0LMI4_HALJT|nr:HAD family hydrolase [Haloarcula japonica]EMA33669.1 Haloacid dehalogenase domain-containing protein hydrolase [Haloarcula japonica DSM 6131]
MALSFDLFGTLVAVDRPTEPWDAVAAALSARSVQVPDDWEAAYRSAHREYDRGREAPLDEHVRLALASRGVEVTEETAAEVVLDAFDSPVTVRGGAVDALAAAAQRGPVAICSNCSVPGLVDRTLERAAIETRSGHEFDAVVTSVDCGWRKPNPHIFESTADALGVGLADLVHVGDDARTDGGAGRAGARSILLDDHSLPAIAEQLREGELC